MKQALYADDEEQIPSSIHTKTSFKEELHEMLGSKYDCYVLITCKKSALEGKMEAEMIYEGDASLAAYLLESAQVMVDGN